MTEAADLRGKSCYLGGPKFRTLQHALMIVKRSFGAMPYLVGSCLERPDYRDVDVRVILEDDQWHALFGGPESPGGEQLPFWSLMSVAVSEYLSNRTGLNVDFQVQRRSAVSDHDWAKPRWPMGHYADYGDPTWFDPPVVGEDAKPKALAD